MQACGKSNLNVMVRHRKSGVESLSQKTPNRSLRRSIALGWGADYPDPDNFMKLFTANSGNNNGRWKNAKYDQLLDQAASEADSEETGANSTTKRKKYC